MIAEQRLDAQAYGVDLQRGFLPRHDPLMRLPAAFADWEAAADDVPALLIAGRLRKRIADLPEPDLELLDTAPELERAMLLLSLLGTAYVWAGAEPATVLPAAIARPWWEIARRVGRPPIVTHASLVLKNWRRLDPAGPLALENLDTLCSFLGGSDERWFYLVTVAIEAAGGPAIAALLRAQESAAAADVATAGDALRDMEQSLLAMLATLRRMPEKCDPYIFYHRVRPYLSSWPEPGVIYEGVDAQPHHFSGGSAAQSSLIQALDAGLGISHISPFLKEMRSYMPPRHRHFIEAVEQGPSLRAFVTAGVRSEPQLASQYNACVGLLDEFRRTHLEYSVRYIKQQAPPEEASVGTGGTEFVELLSEARKDTRASLIKETGA